MCHACALGSQRNGGRGQDRGTHSLPALGTPMPLMVMGAFALGQRPSLTHSHSVPRYANRPSAAGLQGARTHCPGNQPLGTANAKSALLNANKYKPRAGLGPAAPRLNTPASTLLLPRTDHSTKGRITRSSMATHTNRQYHRHPALTAMATLATSSTCWTMGTDQPPLCLCLQGARASGHSLPWEGRGQGRALQCQHKHATLHAASRPEGSTSAPSPPGTRLLPAQHLLSLHPLTFT